MVSQQGQHDPIQRHNRNLPIDRHRPARTCAPFRNQRHCGFTLIELLIGLAIAALLLALAAPSFSSMIASYRLTSQANEIVAAVNLARSEAVKRNRNINLCRSAHADATACADADGLWSSWIILAGADDVVFRNAREPLGTAIGVNSSFGNERVTFGPDGGAIANGTITVCTNAAGVAENRRDIDIGPGNRVATSRTTGVCP